MIKKGFKFYVIVWVILLVSFNLSSLIPNRESLGNMTASFWIGFVFINAALIGQLVCVWMALRKERSERLSAQMTFYNLPLLPISFAGLISCFVFGLLCMLIQQLPYWVGAIVCSLVCFVNLLAVLKAKAAAELVAEVDKNTERKTSFIYEMREESHHRPRKRFV